ncbi:MAG: hypothetical protein ABIH92_04795 [Nanoarchaeota archaeon]
MVKSCIYCKTDIHPDSVVDVCTRCGISVWGEKMFGAIVENMIGAREAGDLYQGSVTETQTSEPKKSGLSSIAQEALATQESNPVERQLEDNYLSEPTKEDIPPLVEVIPETLGPELEIDPWPPLEPQQPQNPQFHQSQPTQKDESNREDAAFIVDNLSRF